MLTDDLHRQIYESDAEEPITVVLQVLTNGTAEEAGASLTERIELAKRPLLDALEKMHRVRVNPLTGMPQAIAKAPAGSWRDLLENTAWLAFSPDYRLMTNVAIDTGNR